MTLTSSPGGPAVDLVRDTPVWDNHACMPLRPQDQSFLPQLQRYRDAGVDVVSLNVCYDAYDWPMGIRMIASFRDWIERHSDHYALATDVDAILTAKSQGRLSIAFDIEGMNAVADQPELVGVFYRLGVRWMLVAYNRDNKAGGGCHGEDAGLTDIGKQVIDQMQKVGMVVCCSHTGTRTTMEVLDYAASPVIFSHSNPRALWDHPRNITDELMKACAETGGVVGINGIGIFLGQNDTRTEAIVNHIKYAVDLIGIDHVGLGIDYCFDQEDLDSHNQNMSDYFPPQYNYDVGVKIVRPEQIPDIANSLFSSGYKAPDIAKVLGGNHLRIAQTVWK